MLQLLKILKDGRQIGKLIVCDSLTVFTVCVVKLKLCDNDQAWC